MRSNTGASNGNPILVTGAHRSGTTWVGKMLATSRQAGYISEPLNVWHRPGVMRARVKYWYTYICADNEAEFLPAIKETIDFRYHPWQELTSLRSAKDLLRMGRDVAGFATARLLGQRALLKDPFAIFSAPWFAGRFGSHVVIIVRHPAAFVSSLVRLNWSFDFCELLAQPLLMRDLLSRFQHEMVETLDRAEDVIAQGCLLWRMIYHVVNQYKERYPDFQILRHEDLSLEPVDAFESLYARLHLEFTDRIRARITAASSPQNPRETSRQSIYAVQLDSRSNLDNWKRRLTSAEIERVRALTADVASIFYTDEAWQNS
jgi:hypothetical protein